jgi:hypothetical protein
MFFVKMDSITDVKLGNMVSPQFKKTICECLKESVGRLVVNLNGSVVICFGLVLKLFLLIPQDHPFLDVLSWITGVQHGGGGGGFISTLIQGHEGRVDLGCNVGLTLTSRSRAGDFTDIMFFVEMDSVTVVKLGNMVSPQWKKMICERLEESVGRLVVNLNGSVVICFGLALKLFLLIPHDHPLLDVISWITGVQHGGGGGGFVST